MNIINQPANYFTMVLIIIMMARPAVQEERIHVANKLSSKILIAHCHSKDDDLGARAIPLGEEISWKFGATAGTLFWCNLAVEDKRLSFVSYDSWDASKDSEYWDVREDGVHGTRMDGGGEIYVGGWRQIY
ncbi:unnamed protein product [Linum tenue]|uniref:S-protein homolog n=1 Tax=Linum tenue TaxID=586396 RepID=A0AAV0L3M2_9ROSI|nr:unnamed protein product [Linum tenue]